MGQLDIFAAQSIAAERQTAVVRDAQRRQVAASRAGLTTPRPAGPRRIPTLLARLGLSRQHAAV